MQQHLHQSLWGCGYDMHRYLTCRYSTAGSITGTSTGIPLKAPVQYMQQAPPSHGCGGAPTAVRNSPDTATLATRAGPMGIQAPWPRFGWGCTTLHMCAHY